MRGSQVPRAVVIALLACLPAMEGVALGSSRVLLATTTSAANSGLLDALLPAFERDTGVHVDYVAVGTGVALKYGENGDVDAVLTHDPEAELAFVRRKFGLARIPFMQSDFVILGPPSDAASIAGCRTAAEAFQRIAAKGAPFVSRGDSSGTHKREREIWRAAGIEPGGRWYVEIGQAMGTCLVMASERGAYTLGDRGTYLARQDALQIAILLEGDPALANSYSIIAVSPDRRPRGNHEGARRLIDWLLSPEGQSRIAGYRVKGRPLFLPVAPPEGKE